MAKKTKTWAEKYVTRTQPEIKRIDKPFADIPAGGLMLIATPAIIEAYLREIPAGKTVSLSDLRKDLAHQYNAEYTCPVTTGIFLRIVAEAGWDRYLAGAPIEQMAPFWRVMDAKSPAAKKLRCGAAFIAAQRAQEARL